MYHYSARQALIDAKQQQLLTAAARARTLCELREPRRRWRRRPQPAEPMPVRPLPYPAEQPA
jgi:hypothetical protein